MFINSADWGPFKLYSIETGRFRLDGGAMFGVVPKTMWSKRVPADDNNRIPMVMRCLLVESQASGRRYLIDTGTGPKFDAKMRGIYEYDDTEYSMDQSLAAHGFTADDITDIIFTHLHFDHCGGASEWAEDGVTSVSKFKNATYWVNRRHWETATNPNAREKASFLRENLAPLHDTARLRLVDDEYEWEPGLSTLNMDGHTLGMQLPCIDSGNSRLVYCADLIPMAAHVPLPWVMAYDMNPTQTLLEKQEFLEKAIADNWYLFIEHDEFHQIVAVKGERGRYEIDRDLKLEGISDRGSIRS
jgi:glyoxylase-like metal-dependent hydrolase (beta-lactamase superfamily II)